MGTEANNAADPVSPVGIKVWFLCTICTEYTVCFSSVKGFLDHKKEQHFSEFRRTTSVVFEEKKRKSHSVHDFLSRISRGDIPTEEAPSHPPKSAKSVSVPAPAPVPARVPASGSVAKSPPRSEQKVPVPVQSCTTDDIDAALNDSSERETPMEEFISSPKHETNSDEEFESDPLGPDPSPSLIPINSEPFLRPLAPRPMPVTITQPQQPLPMQLLQPIKLLLLPPSQQQQQQPTNVFGLLTPVTPLRFDNIGQLPSPFASSSGSGPGPGPGPSFSNLQSGVNNIEEIPVPVPVETKSNNSGPPFVCSICKKSFNSNRYLKTHILLHSNARPYKCSYSNCKYAFKLKYELQKHEKRHELMKQNPKVKMHQPSFQFPDSLADESNDPSATLSLKEWLNQLKLKSTKISDENTDDAEIANVILLDPDPTKLPSFQISFENPIRCRLCCTALRSELNLKIHVTHCWLRNKGKHRYCRLCDKALPSSAALQLHNAMVHKLTDGKPTFACEVCGASFFAKYSLTSHQLVHDKSAAKFKCPEPNCGNGFNIKSHLEEHLRRHSQDKPFKCPEEGCSKSFVSKTELRAHSKSIFHTGIPNSSHKAFVCPQENCGEAYNSSRNLKRHLARAHGMGAPVPQHTCELCNKSFTWKTSYTHHMAIHAGSRPFKCDVPGCDKSFRRKQALLEHGWEHSGERPLQCDTCGKDFGKYTSFHQHLQTHKNGSKNEGGESADNLKFSCDICAKKFRYKVNLERHVEAHENQSGSGSGSGAAKKSLEKIFKCTEPNCEKSFSSKFFMEEHMRSRHSQDRPFKCSEEGCSKSFQTRTQLTSHLKILSHTDLSKQKSFQCTQHNCDKVYWKSTTLKEHMSRAHGIGAPLPQYTCGECDKSFARATSYKIHMSMHEGDRRFKCDYEGCGRAFRTKRDLKEHGWGHTGERPFKCDTCGKDFRKYCGYYAHLKIHKKQAEGL